MRDQRKSVSFRGLEIYEYSIRLCDNQGCRDGLGIAIDSVIAKSSVDSLDEYERLRAPIRHRDDLKLSRYDREQLLKKFGCSGAEIESAAARSKKVRGQEKTKVKNLLVAAKRGLSFSSARSLTSSAAGRKHTIQRDPLRNVASDHGGVQRNRQVERRGSADHVKLMKQAEDALEFDTSKGTGLGAPPPMLVADLSALPSRMGSTPIPNDIILTKSLSTMPTRQFRSMLSGT